MLFIRGIFPSIKSLFTAGAYPFTGIHTFKPVPQIGVSGFKGYFLLALIAFNRSEQHIKKEVLQLMIL